MILMCQFYASKVTLKNVKPNPDDSHLFLRKQVTFSIHSSLVMIVIITAFLLFFL